MSNAALVSIHFAKGIYGALPEIIIKTSDPVAFAQKYKYGTPAVLGDTSRYEGYLVTVQDSDGNPRRAQRRIVLLVDGDRMDTIRRAIHRANRLTPPPVNPCGAVRGWWNPSEACSV